MRPSEGSSLSGVAAWISSKSSPSSSLCHLFEIESGGMPLLDTLQSHLRMFRASPECFRSQPPKAAEFISPARQRWERIVVDGKPRRGDIQSNRRWLLALGWVGHADDCIYSDGGRFPAVPRAAPPDFCPQAVSCSSPSPCPSNRDCESTDASNSDAHPNSSRPPCNCPSLPPEHSRSE